MKKILSILGTVGLVSTLGTTVVSCKNENKNNKKDNSVNKKSIGDIYLEIVAGTMNNKVEEIILTKLKEFDSEITNKDYSIDGLSWIPNVAIKNDSKITVNASEYSDIIKDSFIVIVGKAPNVEIKAKIMKGNLAKVHDKVEILVENFDQLVNLNYEVSGDNTLSVGYQRFKGIFELTAFDYGKTKFTITTDNALAYSFDFDIAAPEILVEGLKDKNNVKIGNEINFEIINLNELGKITFSYNEQILKISQDINDKSKYLLKGINKGILTLKISAEKTNQINEYQIEITA